MKHTGLSKSGWKGLRVLRQRIEAAHIPPSKLDETFNLATWNIREFGKKPRKKESLHFIAEVLNQFDLIAVTELRDNLRDLAAVMQILGPYWKAVYSDVAPSRGGNNERIAYVYDKRMLTFTGMAAEADPPAAKDPKTGEYVAKYGWWRSPYMASFRAGTFDFVLLAAHMRWGDREQQREHALKLLADWVHQRVRSRYVVDKDFILLGDFNVPSTRKGDRLFAAITSGGLRMPRALAGVQGTNLSRRHAYDQILHYPRHNSNFTGRGGALDVYDNSFRKLYPGTRLSDAALTYQMSDHLPLWVQIDCDTETEEIEQHLGS